MSHVIIGKHCLKKLNIVDLNIIHNFYDRKYIMRIKCNEQYKCTKNKTYTLPTFYYFYRNEKEASSVILNDVNNIIQNNEKCVINKKTLNIITQLKEFATNNTKALE